MDGSKHRDRIILAATLCLLCLPVLIDLASDIHSTPLRYFAADTFYYLVVARNWANTGIFSFDQQRPTNGFHPLWQVLTGLVYKAGHGLALSDHQSLVAVLLLSIASIAGGLVLLAQTIRRTRGRLPVTFVAFPVGAYALLVLPAWIANDLKGLVNPAEGPLPLFGTLWSFMNGMESGLTFLAFGALALAFCTDLGTRWTRATLLGLSAAALTFARLDHVFIAGTVLVVYALRVPRTRAGLWCVVAAGTVFAVPVIIYAWHNAVAFGSVVPLSGASKSTFPYPHVQNLKGLIWLARYPFDSGSWLDRFYRQSQVLLPCVAVAFYWWARRWPSHVAWRAAHGTQIDALLLGTGAGILVLAGYNYFFVEPYGPGHWYFPVSIPYVTLSLLIVLPEPAPARLWPATVLACATCLTVFAVMQRRTEYHRRYIAFYLDQAPKIRAYYRGTKPRLIEYDDGIVAYATGFPTLCGTGLTIDREGYRALATGRFLDLALKRGFDRATSLVYTNVAAEDVNHFDDFGIRSDDMTVRFDYRTDDGTFGIVRFGPKTASAESRSKSDGISRQ